MKFRSFTYTIAIIAIIAVVTVFLTVVMSPPNTSNEEIIKIGETDWSVDTVPEVDGAGPGRR